MKTTHGTKLFFFQTGLGHAFQRKVTTRNNSLSYFGNKTLKEHLVHPFNICILSPSLSSQECFRKFLRHLDKWKGKSLCLKAPRHKMFVWAILLNHSSHPTSLKLSKADKMISCPPRTRQTAANNSKTRAFVLSKQEDKRKHPSVKVTGWISFSSLPQEYLSIKTLARVV